MTHGTGEPGDRDDATGVEQHYGPSNAAHAAPGDDDERDGESYAISGSFAWTPTVGSAPARVPSAHAQPDPSAYEAPAAFESRTAAGHRTAEPSTREPSTREPSTGDPSTGEPSTAEPGAAATGAAATGAAATAYSAPRYEQPTYPVPPAAQQQAGQPQAYGQTSYAARAASPTPRPEDLLVPNYTPASDEPASWGWRGRLNRASGGLIKPKAAADEIAVRQSILDIQQSFSRPMTVVVVQPKGGAGKTPTTICLSAAFGAHRGGYVVGWDDNETRGTLAVRVSNPDNQQATVWNLLSDLAAFERYDARVGDLSHYVRAQPDAHFDALVSDDNPGNMAQIGESEYKRLHTVLQRFYRMIVVDTGNNVRSSNWQAAVHSADQIVVVSTYQRDVGYSASWVLDHLAQSDRPELAANAVTVLTAAGPTIDRTVRDQLVPHFMARTRAVCEVPYDNELAHGGPIRWAHLAPSTRNAWIHAGATIVNCLAEDDGRARAAQQS